MPYDITLCKVEVRTFPIIRYITEKVNKSGNVGKMDDEREIPPPPPPRRSPVATK